MSNNSGDLGLASGLDFTVESLDEVHSTGPKLPSPSQVTNTMLPELVSGKWRDGFSSVADEAANSVGIQAQQKRDKQVVSIPKRFERLLADACVSGGVHE